jgi:hypothetical protein
MLGETDQLHPDIHAKYGHQFTLLREEAKCIPEPVFLLDENWETTDDQDNAMLKGFLDLKVIWDDAVDIKEWKTGKVYDEHQMQRYLYGMVTLIQHPEVDEVEVETVYLDQNGKDAKQVFHRDNLQFMKSDWGSRIVKVENAIERDMFPANPQFLCRYCDFSKQNGGPCQF